MVAGLRLAATPPFAPRLADTSAQRRWREGEQPAAPRQPSQPHSWVGRRPRGRVLLRRGVSFLLPGVLAPEAGWGSSGHRAAARSFWTGGEDEPELDGFIQLRRCSGSRFRMRGASHPARHSRTERFGNCLVGRQRANFSNLQPFSVSELVALEPGGFSSGSKNRRGGCHHGTLPRHGLSSGCRRVGGQGREGRGRL